VNVKENSINKDKKQTIPLCWYFQIKKEAKMRVMTPQSSFDLSNFNPLCKVQQSPIDGSLYVVKMMFHQNSTQQQQQQQHHQQNSLGGGGSAMFAQQEQANDHPTLKKYIDGWLDFKEKRKVM